MRKVALAAVARHFLQLLEPPFGFTSRLRRETLSAVPHGGDPQDRTASLQRWIHRNEVA
ncbi:MAG: hypothetical protein V7L00_29325 [Nostoc sp.]|uniref:hypothetical protein n=1 Tax=Nostoc sp. TaxID=1180 RepID=UPI002FF9357C